MQAQQTLLYVLSATLVLIGLAGIILPALPGLPLVFAGLVLAAWTDGFQHLHWGWLVPLGALTLLSLIVDFWATAVGAKRVGASRMAIIGAIAGTLVGLFFSIPGILIGPLAGAMAGELLHRRRLTQSDLGDAAKIGMGTWLGIALGIGLKLGLAMAMLGIFSLAWAL